MYQSSIRDKKKLKQFNHVRVDNYDINPQYEEYAYVKKLLGNCRVLVLTNSGTEAIGVIRGSMRKFNKRVLIETGDIVVVSKRDYQDNKVDIVHKYNPDQVQNLINDDKISNVIANVFNYKLVDDTPSREHQENIDYVDFGNISDSDSEAD